MVVAATAEPRETGHAYRGCSTINDYEVLAKLGEGTFGEVHKARSKRTGAMVALKKILMHNERDGFPITALREIKLLKSLRHVNILELTEMAVERSKGKERKKAIMYMVMPYMDHDLSGLLENPDVNFTEGQIKCYMLQLLEGLRFLHSSHILHRDMKAANLLINNKGILQIADFGLARYFDEPSPKPGRGAGEAKRDYTALVVTRWYRPPELLLGLRRYTCAIDLWGVGCVFAEMFRRKPILRGESDTNQIQIIFDLVGSPTDDNMPGWSQLPGCDIIKSWQPRPGRLAQTYRELSHQALSLLASLLRLDWRTRITAIDALEHPYFNTEPLPSKPSDLPTYAHSHEFDRRKFRDQKANVPPPAPAGGTVGLGANGEFAGTGPPVHRDAPGWANNGRPPSRPDSRGPPPPYERRPGPPVGAYDARGPKALPYNPNNRRPPPAWERGGERHRDDRSHIPPAGNRNNVDTYIPSYPGPDAGPRQPRDRDRDRTFDRDREHERPSWRERDLPPRDRRDQPLQYDDRHRERGRRGSGASSTASGDRRRPQDLPRRTRSRSPDREKERREFDRNTELWRR